MNERENQWAQAQAFSDWMIVMRRALAEKEADAEELYRALTVETETLADCRDQANHQTQVNITLSRKLDRSEQALAEAHAALAAANLAWEADQHALHNTRRALIQAEENLVKAEEYLVTAEENFQREYAALRAQLLQAGEALADAHRQIEFLYATMQAMERRVNNENTDPTGGV